MSEIICPHCGSPNPIEADNCSICHKSLYEEPSQPFRPSAGNEMDWLKDYRSFGSDTSFVSDEEAEPGAEGERGMAESEPETVFESDVKPIAPGSSQNKQAADEEADIPEWLARVRARTREDALAEEEEIPVPTEEPKFKVGEPIKTDWLRDLTGEEQTPPPQNESSNFPDWLKRISARSQEAKRAKEAEEIKHESPFDLTGESPAEATSEIPEKPETPASPFLHMEMEVEPETEPPASLDHDSNLFNMYSQELESLAVPPAEAPEQAGIVEEEPPPDLLPPEPEPPKSFDGLPTFITEGLPEEPTSAEIEPFEEIEPIPDIEWLDKHFDEPAEPITPFEETHDGIDWTGKEIEPPAQQPWDALANLERLQAESEEPAAPAEDALANLERMMAESREPAEESESELADFDWLKAQGEEEVPLFDEKEASTDWMTSSKEEHAEPLFAQEPETPAQPGEMPEWLFGLEESQTAGEPPLTFSEPESPATFEPAEESSLYDEDSLPDWLKEEAPAAPVETPAVSAPAQGKPDIPDWLQDLAPAETGAPPREPAFQMEEHIEDSGPLAGFQGILPGRETVTHYTKPPAYASTLQVTEKQRIYATLFDNLISSEKKVEGTVARKVTATSQVLRLFVGILMIGIVTIALFFDAHIAVMPALYPGENAAFFNTIQTITTTTAASRVLVGLDYEPSLSGEVGTTADYVLQDLMAGNSSLAFVSLNSTGPALAEDLVRRANKVMPEYLPDEKVVNLGYLPGGASALAGLASSPASIAPVTIDNDPAWDTGPLQGVTSIQEFDAVLLLTDNSESARVWIEQIQTTAKDTPFLVVSSAQVVPALQPYVHSGQITGLLGGLSGAAAYQQISQDTSSGLSAYWDAYQVGMLLTAIFIILGAAVFGAIQLIGKFKKA